MKKRKLAFIGGSILGLGVLIGLGQMAVKLSPKPIPTTLEGLQASSEAILKEKCLACHSSNQSLPFYASIPVVGSMVKADYEKGVRHFDLADISHLGEAGVGTPPKLTLGWLNKLDKVLVDDTMPPTQYVAFHWGSNLSSSEITILSKWIEAERAVFLKPYGLEQYADHALQPLPSSVPTDAAKVALGKALYHDTRFSKDNTISCASCHSLEKGGTDNEQFSPGVGGSLGGVNAPTTFNAMFHIRQFWDGRAANLAEQAGGPPLNPVEMASENWDEIIAKLEQDKEFTEKFKAVYPEGYSGETLCNAIAEYEKTLITPNSAFDKFLMGDKTALNDKQRAGYELFIEYNCATCHSGPAMGGQSFEYLDLKGDYFAARNTPQTDGDKGLAAFSKKDKDKARFKVPTLRNIELTAPYLHDSSAPTLEDAVKVMMSFQVGKTANQQEVDSLVEFLKTLTGELEGKPLSPKATTQVAPSSEPTAPAAS